MDMKISLEGLGRHVREAAEAFAGLANGQNAALVADIVVRHQPRLVAYGVEEMIRHLELVRDDPSRLAEFFETYVR